MLIAANTEYSGVAFKPPGTVVIVRGWKKDRKLWRWQKAKNVWLVQMVRREFEHNGNHIGSTDYWRTVAWAFDYQAAFTAAEEFRTITVIQEP